MDFNAAKRERERVVFDAFQERLAPLLAQLCPDWLVHHMEINHHTFPHPEIEREARIVIVLRPLGSTRFVDDPVPIKNREPQLPL